MPDLKQLFRASGKKQRDIAEAVGRSEGAVSQWVKGERVIPADLVLTIEAFTGIPRSTLRPDLWENSMPDSVTRSLDADFSLTHLQRLEAESIHVMREVAAEAAKPVMLYSVGKDSAVMLHLAMKAFAPGMPPFPLLHVNTTWKFREMIAFRDRRAAELGLDLIEWINEDGLARGINPFDHGRLYRYHEDRGAEGGARPLRLRCRLRRRPARRGKEPRQGAHLLLPLSRPPLGSQAPAPGALEPL